MLGPEQVAALRRVLAVAAAMEALADLPDNAEWSDHEAWRDALGFAEVAAEWLFVGDLAALRAALGEEA